MIAFDVSTSRFSGDDDRQACCGRRLEHCDCGAPRPNDITISIGTVIGARRNKRNANRELIIMARTVAILVGMSPDCQKIADWIDYGANLKEPRTAVELAAQWRAHDAVR